MLCDVSPIALGDAAVIPIAQRDDVVVAGEQPRHHDREIIRLAAAVDEVGDVKALRHLRRELLRQQRKVRMQIDRGRVLERVDLLLIACDDLGMAVAARRR